MTNLQALGLTSNSIYGSVPSAWSEPGAFPELRLLDLTLQQITGPLPGVSMHQHGRGCCRCIYLSMVLSCLRSVDTDRAITLRAPKPPEQALEYATMQLYAHICTLMETNAHARVHGVHMHVA